MQFDYINFITDPFVLLFIASFTGLLLGRIRVGRFELGTSGGLFTGLLIGWVVYKSFVIPFEGSESIPEFAAMMIQNGVVPKIFFEFTLVIFVAAVGLLASKDLGRVVRRYGLRFVVLGFVVTFVGVLGIYLMSYLFKVYSPLAYKPYELAGVYTGALTSSPGLAAAMEAVARFGKEAEAQIGYGYAIGYAPGVLVVILSMQFIPVLFKIDIEKEKKRYRAELKLTDASEEINAQESGVDIIAFIFVCLAGYFLGSLNMYFGPVIKFIKLGSTGGVLIAALIFGYIGKIGFMNFRMNNKILGTIRELSLIFFLSVVGLRYGYETISSFSGSGVLLAFVSLLDGLFAISMGYIVGRYVLKLNWIILSGAICGGMTSTPGLGAAIDSVKDDDAAAGYGATYPFALLGMVLFTILLSKLA